MNCKLVLEDLESGIDCTNVMSGIKKILVARLEDVATWPSLMATPTEMAENVTMTGSLVMATGKRFFSLYSKKDSGELKYDGQGEEGSRSQRATLTVYNPGMKKSLLGFIRATQNSQLVMLVLTESGEWHLLGDRYTGAVLSESAATSGKAHTDPNGADLTFIYDTPGAQIIALSDEQIEALCTIAEDDDDDHTDVSGTFECEADTTDSDNPTITVAGNIQAGDDTLGLSLLQMAAGSNIWVADVVPDASGDFTVTVPGKEGASVVSPVTVTLLTHVITGGQHIMKSLGHTTVAVS
jgi:hypothetical protein